MTPPSRTRIARRSAATVLAAAALLTACGADTAETAATGSPGPAEGGFPVTITNCDVESTYGAPPERVLLGWGNSMATIQALGVEDSVIGYVSGSMSRLPDDSPEVEELSPDWAPAREIVIAEDPDFLLLTDEGQVAGDGGAISTEDLSGLGANAYVLQGYCLEGAKPDTIETVYDDVRTLGRIFGVPERAEDVVADLEERVDRAKAAQPYETAFVQVYDEALYALGGSTYSAVLDAAGLTNLFAGETDSFVQINPEDVAVLDPEAIAVAYDDLSEAPEAAIARVTSLLGDTEAVEDGRVVAVANSEISASGVSLVDVAEQLAGALGES